MSNTFINSVDNNTDPVIESVYYQLINYPAPVEHQVSYVGFTLGGGATLSLEVGSTTQDIAKKAENYVRYNIFDGLQQLADDRAGVTGETVDANIDTYLDGLTYDGTTLASWGSGDTLSAQSGSFWIESQSTDYNNVSTNANNAKNAYIARLRSQFLNDAAWMKGKIALYDALMNDIDVEDVQDLLRRVNNIIRRNEYTVYQFLNQMLAIHAKVNEDALNVDLGHANHQVGGTGGNIYLLRELVQSSFKKINIQQNETNDDLVVAADVTREYDLVQDVLYYITESCIKPDGTGSYNPRDAVYTYEQMLALNEDLETVFDVVAFFPTMSVRIAEVMNQVLLMKTVLVNEMDTVRYHAESILINISRISNELPYLVGEYMIGKNMEYNTYVKEHIRLTPIPLPTNAQWGPDQGSYRRR